MASPVELVDPCMRSAGVSNDGSQFQVGACPTVRQTIVEPEEKVRLRRQRLRDVVSNELKELPLLEAK